jgi:hypothetical protein
LVVEAAPVAVPHASAFPVFGKKRRIDNAAREG